MLGRVLAASIGLSVVFLVVLFETTTPATIGPVGILLVFILMYVSVLGVLTFLLFLGGKATLRIGTFMTLKRPIHTLTLRRSYYYSSVIALAPVLFIGMQSVGEVSVYDICLVVLFVGIACVYIAKRA